MHHHGFALRLCLVGLGALAVCAPAQSGSTDPQGIDRLARRVQSLEAEVGEQGVPQTTDAEQPSDRALLLELLRRMESVEARLDTEQDEALEVALQEVDLPRLNGHQERHRDARPWFQNVDLWGFASFGFLATGNDGPFEHGGFHVLQSHLHMDFEVIDDISVFLELVVVSRGYDSSYVESGELHARFDDLFGIEGLGLKVGRFDIPFGNEYLRQDAPDNPMISHSVAFPYGLDEGVELFGSVGPVDFIVAVTDGVAYRSMEDNWDKAINVKISGSPTDWLDLSGSFMRTGIAKKSALFFAGSPLQPVGTFLPSTAGSSGSIGVDTILYELDATISICDALALDLTFGQAFTDDRVSAFNRDFYWFSALLQWSITQEWYLAARYSEIGTHDDSEGFAFNGAIFSALAAVYGHDTDRLRRLSFGVGWRPNPHIVVKAEAGFDTVHLIDVSTLENDNDGRWFFGVELTASF